MAVYETSPTGQRVVTSGQLGQCRCGKPAETEIQTGYIPEANAGAGGGQYDQICWACRDEDKAQWGDSLAGGWRVENVRPLDGDPMMKWQGEVVFGENDVQTLRWTAEGQYIAWMKSEYDLVDNEEWQDLDLDEISDLAFRLVQTRQPIEVRLRDCADDDWSNEQLVGFRLDLEEDNRVIYFVDANGGDWLYCQVYR